MVNPDNLFNLNYEGLLELVCGSAKTIYPETQYEINKNTVLFYFSKIKEPIVYYCDYEKKEQYLEITKNNQKFKLTIPVENGICNEDYNRSMFNVFYDNFYTMYEHIEQISQPNHITSLPYTINAIE